MTVAVLVKVWEGLVLAADATATVASADGRARAGRRGRTVFALHDRLPVAAVTWGAAETGAATVPMLVAELRRRLAGQDPARPEWALGGRWSVRSVADRLVDLAWEAPPERPPPGVDPAGLLVAGFSPGAEHGEAWRVDLAPGARPLPELELGGPACGWTAFGRSGPALRLFRGYDPRWLPALAAALPAEAVSTVDEMLGIPRQLAVTAATPLGDAVAFARYVVGSTAGYHRLVSGEDAGPVGVAVLTRHAGMTLLGRALGRETEGGHD
ncbi:MAG TPA: hypothetical protein VFQ85_18125 [Mycobacteriales bacterium]|nr:hypothetical protein [Mycobacteriales bacterium]